MIQLKDEFIRECKIKGIKKQMEECINAAYSKGYCTCLEQRKEKEEKAYEKGYEQHGKDFVEKGENAYQKGLDDAWEAARKIVLDDGLHLDELYVIFDDDSSSRILEAVSASEAVEKIQEYEEKQEQKEAKERFREKLESGYFSGKQKQKDNIEIKVGTKVRTTKDHDHSDIGVFPIGTVGTITEIGLRGISPYKVSAYGTHWWYSKDMFEVIEEGENQEEQDLKVGNWIALGDCSNSGYYCSECRKKVVKEGWSDTVKKIKFCPNCGAKMEES